jgi:hypothetical protein
LIKKYDKSWIGRITQYCNINIAIHLYIEYGNLRDVKQKVLDVLPEFVDYSDFRMAYYADNTILADSLSFALENPLHYGVIFIYKDGSIKRFGNCDLSNPDYDVQVIEF